MPFLLLLTGLLMLAGCSETPGEPETGALRVTVSSTGTADPDGYTVALDDGAPRPIAATGDVVFDDLAPGEYVVTLGGLAEHCTTDGSNARSVSVAAASEASAVFTVTCAALGTLRITTLTGGGPLDPDGYVVRVDGVAPQPIPANGVLELPGLTAGPRGVTLDGLWVYCGFPGTDAGTSSVSSTIQADATVNVEFTISCQAALRNRIVYSALRSTSLQIFAIRPDGTGDTPISPPSSAIIGSFLTVSRDGESLVYVTGGPEVTHLELMNSLGAVIGEIPISVQCATTPGLSHDGGRLAFSLCFTNPELRVSDIDGTDEAPLGGELGYNPVWTAAGDRVVFSRLGTIASVGSDGSDAQPITSLPGEQAFDPDVSPDGSRVVFARSRPTVPTTTGLYVINTDGTGERLLWEGNAYHAHPSWSPDGTRIVFSQDIPSGLYIIDADGGTPVELVSNPSSIAWPTWTW